MGAGEGGELAVQTPCRPPPAPPHFPGRGRGRGPSPQSPGSPCAAGASRPPCPRAPSAPGSPGPSPTRPDGAVPAEQVEAPPPQAEVLDDVEDLHGLLDVADLRLLRDDEVDVHVGVDEVPVGAALHGALDAHQAVLLRGGTGTEPPPPDPRPRPWGLLLCEASPRPISTVTAMGTLTLAPSDDVVRPQGPRTKPHTRSEPPDTETGPQEPLRTSEYLRSANVKIRPFSFLFSDLFS